MADLRENRRLENILHHVFLPPKLPGCDDQGENEWEDLLTFALANALEEFGSHAWPEPDLASIRLATEAVKKFRSLTTASWMISARDLTALLKDLRTQELTVPLYIGPQNAGIIIRSSEKHIIFETFELSPTNEAVFANKGRLRRDFPAATVSVPCDVSDWEGLLSSISSLMADMSTKPVPEMQPTILKAHDVQVEERDTTKPHMVTQLLMAALRPFGDVRHRRVIWKNTREEVRYAFGNKLPWRRSPVWLLMRVVLQLTLTDEPAAPAPNDSLYKKFMVYFMARLLKLSLGADRPSDDIYIMNAKITRRLRKLDVQRTEPWMLPVCSIIRDATAKLNDRWDNVVQQDIRTLKTADIFPLSFGQECNFSLPSLGEFLSQIRQRATNMEADTFVPSSSISRVTSESISSPAQAGSGEYRIYNIVAFENWVAQCLPNWINDHLHDPSSCAQLHSAMREYSTVATTAYKSKPEGHSIMLLVLLELWVACDRSAAAIYPLVLDYDPEVPAEICSSLLLRFRSQMKRLSEIERYVHVRKQKAIYKRTSIFTTFGTVDTFAVQFYKTSSHHQELLNHIESKAKEEQNKKRLEFRQKKKEHDDLIAKSEALDHAEIMVTDQWGDKYPQHPSSCKKCCLAQQAANMEIQIHEWPLPNDPTEARAVVFELDLHSSFREWRDCTYFLRTHVLGPWSYLNPPNPPYSYRLDGCDALIRFKSASKYVHQTVMLASTTKPNAVTHRRGKKIGETSGEEEVCLSHGMKWLYFDTEKNFFFRNIDPDIRISKACTFFVSPSLQDFLCRSWDSPDGPAPNKVIASQWRCPDYLSLDEFKALCSLPLGHKIIWENLLREFAMPSVDWRKVETALFVLQITHQAGPCSSDSDLRESHVGLEDEALVKQLVKEMDKSLSRLKENWESVPAVATLIMVTARLLSLTRGTSIQICLSFLFSCRKTCFKWLQTLRGKVQSTQDTLQLQSLNRRVLQAALACSQSYDIDAVHLASTLKDTENLSKFIQCCIAVQECYGKHEDSKKESETSFLDCLNLRYRRLLFRTKKVLMRQITSQENQGLDFAIANIWPSYKRLRGDTWTKQASCWLKTSSSNQDGTVKVQVHYNVVTAELLVKGLPLGRLPSKYEAHKDYVILFGRSSVDVMPSAEAGMRFSTRCSIQGHQIHLAYDSQRGDLNVRACMEDNAWELVPSRLFEKHLPKHFFADYIHWYNTTKDIVEFRPHSQPWKSGDSSWTLRKQKYFWILQRSSTFLVNPSSRTAKQLFEVLRPLEKQSALHIFFDKAAASLLIEIPRLQLEFYMMGGSENIMSRQYRGMRVDPQQAIGTLVGLVDKLVLAKVGDSQSRLVLIPDCEPCYQRAPSQHHIKVTLHYSAARVQSYQLNHHLHCLSGNGSLKSKLFLAELHALTSGLIEDPFTLHTGTEEALTILRSAGVRSFGSLSEEEVEILQRIASLSPARNFYPKALRVMQVVDWDQGLSPLSQHLDFSRLVRALFHQASETSFLHKDFIKLPRPNWPHQELEDREAIRSSSFYKVGFGAEWHTTADDAPYTMTRDHGQDSKRASRVLKVAAVFSERPLRLPFHIPQNAAQTIYQNLRDLPILNPQQSRLPNLSFDANWVGTTWPHLKKAWGGIQKAFETRKSNDPFAFFSWVVSVAFARDIEETTLSVLLGLMFFPQYRVMAFPQDCSLKLNDGHQVDIIWLRKCIESHYIEFEESTMRNQAQQRLGESHRQAIMRVEALFEDKKREFARNLEAHVLRLWPSTISDMENAAESMVYLQVPQAMQQIREKCKSWHNNRLFLQSLERICAELRRISVGPSVSWPMGETPILPDGRSVHRYVAINDLFDLANTSELPRRDFLVRIPDIVAQAETYNESHLVSSLRSRIARLAKLPQEGRYVEHLAESISQLGQNTQQSRLTINGEELHQVLDKYHQRCLTEYNDFLIEIEQLLSWSTPHKEAVSSMHMIEGTVVWPCVSPRDLLVQLSREKWGNLSKDWKEIIANFGSCLSQLQGAKRLLQLRGNETDLIKELVNLGLRTWDPLEYPDSLLLEVEGNLRIRKVQQQIAETMESPPTKDKKNAVMQLNMGEGKSSVIVPIVAAALANGSNLVRIIVGKPQSRQMFETLVSKLGGLIGRRVYHMPFSRSLRPSTQQAYFLERHYQECRKQGGVLLLQPENILSFQLMVLEAAIKEEVALSDTLLRMKANFFDEYSRDIIDESDENFSVKFELLYTIGLQTPVDYAPERWTIIQQILGLVIRYALKVSKELPKSVEVYIATQSKRPRVRFLDKEASDRVTSLVANHVCEYGLLPGFPVSRLSKLARVDIRDYITNSKPSDEVASRVKGSDFWASSCQSLLLIRGLFAGSILDFVFSKKRWRVNYGLDTTREPNTRLAVPYRAKDNPSQRSEFSQPDVVISLTSISYYYGGLTDEELFLSLNHLLKSDQADGEYQSWVQSIDKLPEAFRQLEGINITDRQLCIDHLFPYLRYSKGVIDYFLSKIVFVKEMKEFPDKLSASGWDLGRIKKLPATGFSGTNDSQHALPLTVKQLDLPAQKHTNALVLDILMRPENSVALLSTQNSHSAVWSAMQLLELTVKMDPETRVILDVGAQIIDLSNKDVAKAWLKLVEAKQDIQAVIFCDDDDELSVLDRQGHVERLQTSPFAKHLDACLVFLDEAHTRGIDLRLPQNYRAAVTLGANLVKDRLVQACMRMRKLGQGQSVVFYVPEEIETKIRALRTADSDSTVDEPIAVLDVLAWSISETWTDIRRSFPIWATQGTTFARQQDYWQSMRLPDGKQVINKELASRFLEKEAQTLEQRYGLQPRGSSVIDSLAQSQKPMLQEIFQRYSEFGNINLDASSLQEEQERELAPEIEEEREKERAKPAEPLPHGVHPDVSAFVRTGVIKRSSAAVQPSFQLFESTSAAAELRAAQWPSGLLITKDFARTVKLEDSPKHSYMDDFLRSVQWILTSSVREKIVMVVISPYEANQLRDDIAKSRVVVRHLYGARQNQGIAPIDDLDLYTLPGRAPRHEIPQTLIIELNLFAGQLYFRSFQEYTKKAAEEGQEVTPDGFILRAVDDETCAFTASPVKFLKAIIGRIRFNCEGIEKTHLGKILEGALLTEDDFREI
ncbi:unnamed protein product [Clonostachys rosea]|uniref:ubiquitinyl hydrolase 1 n=1 Tax=Bionectria ochroleuca TaxID=29856 RepID=A0ABY6U2G8_BIOOC|nr:unnamed protein product [Clonostachys rosea]